MGSGVEAIKASSNGLRGSVAEELAAPGAKGGLSEAAYTLLKFHGTYEQFDRDSATARKQAGEDKDWSFMVRVRMPAGRLTAAQWLALDDLAGRHADATLKLTTRQGVQFHTIRRGTLATAIAEVDRALLTTLAACGDVVRNVITSPAPIRDAIHARLEEEARRLSSALLPRTRAHHEIFLGEEPAAEEAPDPLYGPTYLPRKFKIALAHPGDNTPDLLANDLGFLAVAEGDRIAGWIVTLGGGMGMTHNKPATFPRLADAVALIGPDEVLEVARAAVRLSRDHGDRTDRKHARLKYVLAERGAEWARATLSADLGRDLGPPPPLPRLHLPELLGWQPQGDGRFWLGVPVPGGRVDGALRAALRAIVARFGADPIVTPQQDVLLSNLRAGDRAAAEALLAEAGVTPADRLTPLARWTLACTALPTCGQALAEGERVRGEVLAQVQAALDRHGVGDRRVSLRITGCPNGCARPYAGDIGVVGRAPGLYTLFVGGDFEGTRLSFPVADKVALERIGATLEPLVARWAALGAGEGFGAFCTRLGPDAARAALAGALAA
ncbi:MAG: NADPH-dependent assimilatory sulfite reductase hemoprotein subunit [Acetobacteraceae bacterium]|nr:NADPH-dependent assimilatory sulfite reductase hemoprotein subunit [Acetobacteraceae bacterium]